MLKLSGLTQKRPSGVAPRCHTKVLSASIRGSKFVAGSTLRKSQLHKTQRGFTIIEVLVAIIILAFGLLGLAALQGKLQLSQFESYQRVQALLLLSEMAEKMSANRSQASSYASSTVLGTGDAQPATCTGGAGVNYDLCEWSNNLKGAAELSGTTKIGAMVGARGCITQVQAPNLAAGICTPAIYRIDVVWQGMQATAAPAVTCAQGNYGGNDALRRAVSAQITVGLPTCS